MTDAGAKCFTGRVAVAQVAFFFCCFQPVISSCGFGLPVSASLSRFKRFICQNLGLPVLVSLSVFKRFICQNLLSDRSIEIYTFIIIIVYLNSHPM